MLSRGPITSRSRIVLLRTLLFQMDLPAKFRRIAHSVHRPVTQLVEGKNYYVEFAERIITQQGPTVQFLVSDIATKQLYITDLPKRYARVVTDSDINDISFERVCWYLKYEGYCRLRRQPILELS